MFVDYLTQFCDATSIAGTAGTALVGAQIPLGSTGLNLGAGSKPIWLVIRTTTEIITAGTASTIQFFLASDATAAISTTTATIHLSSEAFVTDDAAANDAELNAYGTIMCAQLPSGVYENFLGILCTIGAETVTAGAIDAFLTNDPNLWKAYPDAL